MKYENGGNLRSTAAPQIRRVLSRPKNDQFWRVFYPFPPIFLLFHPPYAYTKPILQKKSGLAWIFWPRWRVKVFASTQGGLPPPTQLTNTNIKIMKIRVSWVGQSTKWGRPLCISMAWAGWLESRSTLPISKNKSRNTWGWLAFSQLVVSSQ